VLAAIVLSTEHQIIVDKHFTEHFGLARLAPLSTAGGVMPGSPVNPLIGAAAVGREFCSLLEE